MDMIKAKELRIGNWIDLKNSGHIKIDVDNIGDIVNNPTIFDPIPLTPEILEACGFRYIYIGTSNLTTSKIKHNTLRIHGDSSVSILDESEHETGAVLLPNKCEYLHQLQNLYWWLCGEELIYKP